MSGTEIRGTASHTPTALHETFVNGSCQTGHVQRWRLPYSVTCFDLRLDSEMREELGNWIPTSLHHPNEIPTYHNQQDFADLAQNGYSTSCRHANQVPGHCKENKLVELDLLNTLNKPLVSGEPIPNQHPWEFQHWIVYNHPLVQNNPHPVLSPSNCHDASGIQSNQPHSGPLSRHGKADLLKNAVVTHPHTATLLEDVRPAKSRRSSYLQGLKNFQLPKKGSKKNEIQIRLAALQSKVSEMQIEPETTLLQSDFEGYDIWKGTNYLPYFKLPKREQRWEAIRLAKESLGLLEITHLSKFQVPIDELIISLKTKSLRLKFAAIIKIAQKRIEKTTSVISIILTHIRIINNIFDKALFTPEKLQGIQSKAFEDYKNIWELALSGENPPEGLETIIEQIRNDLHETKRRKPDDHHSLAWDFTHIWLLSSPVQELYPDLNRCNTGNLKVTFKEFINDRALWIYQKLMGARDQTSLPDILDVYECPGFPRIQAPRSSRMIKQEKKLLAINPVSSINE
ncbi:hypothetical protein O181_074721 [Austropuccinia psidii MF-1]|uniref:Uncharacterized protein n=1 Tax=Austropuccinia psidii MF-1 TaxID=1389203 RepID=A0A9Q3F739_9BASI|nr:hypothetical protein [Austropuccinia psidii MF-1]